MYNASGSSMVASGAMLAMTGPGDYVGIVTFIALVLIAIGGILIVHGSRMSQKEIKNELN